MEKHPYTNQDLLHGQGRSKVYAFLFGACKSVADTTALADGRENPLLAFMVS